MGSAVSLEDANQAISTLSAMLAQAKEARSAAMLAQTGSPGVKWVTLDKLEQLTGFTVGAARGRIDRGDWPLGLVYKKAPGAGKHNRIMVSVEGFNLWVENGSQAFARGMMEQASR